jgi:hypothetical protein
LCRLEIAWSCGDSYFTPATTSRKIKTTPRTPRFSLGRGLPGSRWKGGQRGATHGRACKSQPEVSTRAGENSLANATGYDFFQSEFSLSRQSSGCLKPRNPLGKVRLNRIAFLEKSKKRKYPPGEPAALEPWRYPVVARNVMIT